MSKALTSDQAAIDSARTGDWQVIKTSAEYWDVAERLNGLVAPTQQVNEVAYSPVCRVKRHIPGKRNLALILAAPDLLAACEAYVHGRKEARECEAMMRAAIAKATQSQPTVEAEA